MIYHTIVLPVHRLVHCLGITIDPTLMFVSNVLSRVQFRVASILRFGSLSPGIIFDLYTAFVLPLFGVIDVFNEEVRL